MNSLKWIIPIQMAFLLVARAEDPCAGNYLNMSYPRCSDDCDDPNVSAEYIQDFTRWYRFNASPYARLADSTSCLPRSQGGCSFNDRPIILNTSYPKNVTEFESLGCFVECRGWEPQCPYTISVKFCLNERPSPFYIYKFTQLGGGATRLINYIECDNKTFPEVDSPEESHTTTEDWSRVETDRTTEFYTSDSEVEVETTSSLLDASSTEKQLQPVFESLYPPYGPVAGGTIVTITGDNLDLIRRGNISLNLSEIGTLAFWSATEIVFITPEVDDTLAGMSMIVALEALSTTNRSWEAELVLPFNFTYQGNPIVTDVYPLRTILQGGTAVTVEGTSLDSIASPQLEITTVHTIENSSTTSSFYGICSHSSSEKLSCTTPSLNISDKFLEAIKNSTATETTLSPVPSPSALPKFSAEAGIDTAHEVSRATSDTTYRLVVDGETLELYIGVLLDGVDAYKYDEKTSTGWSSIKLTKTPTVHRFSETKMFNPDEHNYISIWGDALGHLQMADYTVRIGRGICRVIELFDNHLTCAPPAQMPDAVHRNNFNTSQRYTVVFIGSHVEYGVGNVYYLRTTVHDNMVVISVSAVLTLILIICTIICFVRRHQTQSYVIGEGKHHSYVRLLKWRNRGSKIGSKGPAHPPRPPSTLIPESAQTLPSNRIRRQSYYIQIVGEPKILTSIPEESHNSETKETEGSEVNDCGLDNYVSMCEAGDVGSEAGDIGSEAGLWQDVSLSTEDVGLDTAVPHTTTASQGASSYLQLQN